MKLWILCINLRSMSYLATQAITTTDSNLAPLTSANWEVANWLHLYAILPVATSVVQDTIQGTTEASIWGLRLKIVQVARVTGCICGCFIRPVPYDMPSWFLLEWHPYSLRGLHTGIGPLSCRHVYKETWTETSDRGQTSSDCFSLIHLWNNSNVGTKMLPFSAPNPWLAHLSLRGRGTALDAMFWRSRDRPWQSRAWIN